MSRSRAGEPQSAQESALQMKAIVIYVRLFYYEISKQIERKIKMEIEKILGNWQQAYD